MTQLLKLGVGVFTTDVVFCWFASTYAAWAVMLASLLRKRSLVVIGGIDVAKDEELGYGIWLSPWKSRLVRYALRNATHVLAVDESLKPKAVRLAEYNGENISVVPTGYDAEFWMPAGQKENLVLTVAVAHDLRRLRVKGIDLLADTARLLPNIPFVVVGVNPAVAAQLHPPANIAFQETIQREQLLPFYQRAKIYFQPSRHEGLPNTLCEAMLCECIPVVADVGGMKQAVGDAGLIAERLDAAVLAENIRVALQASNQLGEKGRRRIQSLFQRARREASLINIISA